MTPDDASAAAAILLLTAVTLGTRLAGPFLMQFVQLTPRIERFLESMAIAVIAAIVVTQISATGLRGAGAALVAALLMLKSRQAALAMFGAMIFAAAWNMLQH